MSRISREGFVGSAASTDLEVENVDGPKRPLESVGQREALAGIAGRDGISQGESEMDALFALIARPPSGVGDRTPGMTAAGRSDPPWLQTAFGEWRVRETAGAGATPRIMEYFASTWAKDNHKDDSGKANAWCGAFVTWALTENGVKNGKAVGARSYQTWGEPSEPFRGAIITMEKNGQKHVAMIAGVDKEGHYVVLGGNQDDEVNLKSTKGSTILAIRKPTGYDIPVELKTLPTIDAGVAQSTR